MDQNSIHISDFRTKIGSNDFRSISKEYYDWKIYKNPFHEGTIFLKFLDGEVIGSTTLTPKIVSIFDNKILAAEIGDTFTHSDHRRKGIFSEGVQTVTQYAVSNGFELIYGTPNNQSLPGYKNKLGYPPCNSVSLKLLTKNTSPLVHFTKSISKMVLDSTYHNFFGLISPFLSTLNGRSSSPKPQIIETNDVCEICALDQIRDEIDGFWGRPRYIFSTVRDRTYLNWRYFSNPDSYQILIARKGKNYLGYLVTKISDSGNIGTLCDFITMNDRIDIFQSLVREAEQRFIKSGVKVIRLYCAEESPYYRVLQNESYYDHGHRSEKTVIVFAGTEIGKNLFERYATWHFTLSDSDNI